MVTKLYTPNCEIKPGMEVPLGVSRWALVVEYNGAPFQGFQRQKSAKYTVQGVLEQALSRIANEPITLVCAGRTDAGVHATQQVIHFDTFARRPAKAWLEGVNTHLPDEVRVKRAIPVDLSFHARFSAQSRIYRYLTLSSATKPAILSRSVTWLRQPLTLEPMITAARHLIGEHDFTSFRSSQCQAHSPCRNVMDLTIQQVDSLFITQIQANAFLHHMVRNIMGTLHWIGMGRKAPDWTSELLRARDRNQAAPTASADGLYFVSVQYPEGLGVSLSPTGPFFLDALKHDN